ncbi:MAG: DUF3016 domain-containing protein [Telluria sp.]
MNTLTRSCALAALLLLAASAAGAGQATVRFANPEQFTDMPREAFDRERVLADLSEHFGALAAKLPAGQHMTVDVLDLDMAGRSWPALVAGRELRVLEGGADWPHIKFRYTISQDGKVLRSGQETVQNMDYLSRLNRYSTGDALRYEKQMLDTWFKTLIAAR